MITVIKRGNAYNRRVISLEGLSTDTKPVEYFIETDSNGVEVAKVYIENGSTFTEIDTGKLFMYDAENTVWYEIETSGGGGGGGTGTDNYNLLTNKPKINNVEIKGNKSLVDLGILFGSSLVAEIDSNTYVVTLTLKDQEGNILGETQSLDLPLESVVVGGRYDNTTKKVVLTLQNGNTIEFSVADLVDGLQSELSSTNKLNPEFINYNSTHRAVSDSEKTTWNGKQDALTFDNTPTNGSSNPVKSGGVYAALDNKVDKVTGKGLSTNDFTNEDKTQITTNKNGIAAVANRCSKNLLKASATTQTVNGITFTVNADGTVTISGTATAAATLTLATASQINSFLPLGTYKLSGCTGGSTTTYDLRFYHPGDSSTVLNHNGDTQFTRNATKTDSNISILVRSGQVMDNVVIKPMIRDASIEDDTYQPYAPTNRELYETKQDNLTFDATPTSNSTNPVTSGGLFSMFRNTVNRQSTIGSTGDLNDAKVSGFYKFNGSPANVPSTGTAAYGMLIVFDYDNYILQLCYRFDTSATYIRASSSTGSSWGAWKELQSGS